jgi:outer membrane protein OmpA-like peptidoglycan-associated protein
MKQFLLTSMVFVSLFTRPATAQPNCFDDYTAQFKKAGAEAVPDGMQRVIVGVKTAEGNQSCAEGEIMVKNGAITPPLYLRREDGTFAVSSGNLDRNFYRQAEGNVSGAIDMGMSAVFKLIYSREGRLFFIDYVKPDPGRVVEAKREGNLYPGAKIESEHIEKINVSAKAIQFQTGKAQLAKDSYAVLDAIADLIKAYPNSKWAIDGHTDNTGSADKNFVLSENRAQAVADQLVKNGIPARNLYVNGHGADRPIADNATSEGRKINRRVEIKPL